MLNSELCNLHTEMDLRTYTDKLPHGGMADFAGRCGISPIYLSQLAARQDGRVPSAKLCNVMVRESAGALTRQELRPEDYWEHWPDLTAPTSTVAPAVDRRAPSTLPMQLSASGQDVAAPPPQGKASDLPAPAAQEA